MQPPDNTRPAGVSVGLSGEVELSFSVEAAVEGVCSVDDIVNIFRPASFRLQIVGL